MTLPHGRYRLTVERLVAELVDGERASGDFALPSFERGGERPAENLDLGR
jgi:hypothetical protein